MVSGAVAGTMAPATHVPEVFLGNARLDVTVTRFRTRRTDAKNHDIFPGGGNFNSSGQSFAVSSWLGDDVVGGKKSEHGFGIMTL